MVAVLDVRVQLDAVARSHASIVRRSPLGPSYPAVAHPDPDCPSGAQRPTSAVAGREGARPVPVLQAPLTAPPLPSAMPSCVRLAAESASVPSEGLGRRRLRRVREVLLGPVVRDRTRARQALIRPRPEPLTSRPVRRVPVAERRACHRVGPRPCGPRSGHSSCRGQGNASSAVRSPRREPRSDLQVRLRLRSESIHHRARTHMHERI